MTRQLHIQGENGWQICTICEKKTRGYGSSSKHSRENHPREVLESNLWYAEAELRKILSDCRRDFDIARTVDRDDIPESIRSILNDGRSYLSDKFYGSERYAVSLLQAEEKVQRNKAALS